MLEVGVVAAKGLFNLVVNEISLFYLASSLLSFLNLWDALFDDFSCDSPHFLPIVAKGLKYVDEVLLLTKKQIEGDNFLFAAKFAENQDSRILFDVVWTWICVLFQPLNCSAERGVDHLSCNRSSSFGQISQTLSPLLNQLGVVGF